MVGPLKLNQLSWNSRNMNNGGGKKLLYRKSRWTLKEQGVQTLWLMNMLLLVNKCRFVEGLVICGGG